MKAIGHRIQLTTRMIKQLWWNAISMMYINSFGRPWVHESMQEPYQRSFPKFRGTSFFEGNLIYFFGRKPNWYFLGRVPIEANWDCHVNLKAHDSIQMDWKQRMPPGEKKKQTLRLRSLHYTTTPSKVDDSNLGDPTNISQIFSCEVPGGNWWNQWRHKKSTLSGAIILVGS